MVEVTDSMVEAGVEEMRKARHQCFDRWTDHAAIRAALEAALASPAEVVETPPPESQLEGAKECECFGDSGLHASTFVPVGSDREHCDLCGYPVPTDSTDVLSAINQPHQAREDASRPPQQEPARLREEGWQVEYEVLMVDGDFCASSTSLPDAKHYAAMYQQDGPVEIVEVRRRKLAEDGL